MQDGDYEQPGSVIQPGGAEPSLPPVSPESQQEPEQIQTSEQFGQAPQVQTDASVQYTDQAIQWTASEYIANQKNAGWFSLLIFGSIVLAAVVYLLTKDVVSTVVIGMLAVIIAIFANHKPRALDYRIDDSGVHIGQKTYPFTSFKSFSVGQEHAMNFISLMPLKRFMPPISIHYAPEDEAKITETLADYLPYEEHKPDAIDRLSKKLRF